MTHFHLASVRYFIVLYDWYFTILTKSRNQSYIIYFHIFFCNFTFLRQFVCDSNKSFSFHKTFKFATETIIFSTFWVLLERHRKGFTRLCLAKNWFSISFPALMTSKPISNEFRSQSLNSKSVILSWISIVSGLISFHDKAL